MNLDTLLTTPFDQKLIRMYLAEAAEWAGYIKKTIEELELYEGKLQKCGQMTASGSVWLRFEKNSYWLKIEKQSTVTPD